MSQATNLYKLLSDGRPHRTDEIVSVVYGPGLSLARVGARIWDIKKKYSVEIKGWHDEENPALYWYQVQQPVQSLQPVDNSPKPEPVKVANRIPTLFPVERKPDYTKI